MERQSGTQRTWTIVRSPDALDPQRYLGELTNLPIGARDPGDWCDVVMRDREGAMRWTLVLLERASTTAPAGPPQETGSRLPDCDPFGWSPYGRSPHKWEREGGAAAAPPAPPSGPSTAAGTDGIGASRRLGLLWSRWRDEVGEVVVRALDAGTRARLESW